MSLGEFVYRKLVVISKSILPPPVYRSIRSHLIRVKLRFLRSLRLAGKKHGAVLVDGIWLTVDDPLVSETIRNGILLGLYEFPERCVVERVIRSSDIVLELGAGSGYMGIVCSRIVGEDRVHMFEANPALRSLISRNLQLNKVNPTLEIALLGVGDGVETFWVCDDFYASSSNRIDGSRSVEVPRRDLNRTIERLKPTALIMDIEGAEYDIVMALDPGTIKKIILECHPKIIGRDRVEQMFKQLASLGFQTHPLERVDNVFFLSRQ